MRLLEISLVLNGRLFQHCSLVKLFLYILVVALVVSLIFRVIEWPWVAYRQAETLFANGNYRGAVGLYERAAQKVDDLAVLGPLATCYLALGRYGEAETALTRILEKRPEQLPTIRLLAGLYQQSQHPEKAIPLFTRYLSLGKKLDPPTELQLANIYRQAGRYDDAVPYYQQAAQDPKQKIAATVALAELRSWQGRYDDAIALCRDVLQTDPANRDARLGLAHALSWAGRFKEAEEEYRKLLNKP
jgi:tetratricopeptide (TPR) repeat protein